MAQLLNERLQQKQRKMKKTEEKAMPKSELMQA
jgi:hypothetical protein